MAKWPGDSEFMFKDGVWPRKLWIQPGYILQVTTGSGPVAFEGVLEM